MIANCKVKVQWKSKRKTHPTFSMDEIQGKVEVLTGFADAQLVDHAVLRGVHTPPVQQADDGPHVQVAAPKPAALPVTVVWWRQRGHRHR